MITLKKISKATAAFMWFTVSVTCFFSISDRMEKCNKYATSILLHDMDHHGDKLNRIRSFDEASMSMFPINASSSGVE